ncbi:MAG TPA: hypothetical protein VHN74_08135 [Candidatus Angelobacter sp.]|jgi:hypothetical protein|nr:hypothetical protein [Candidatus Angelobacter sp.]
MRIKTATLLAIIVLAVACLPLPAQTKPDPYKGFTEYETFQGTVNSDSRLFKLDSTIGWDFNKHFGVFGGVPLYFSHASATASGTTTTTTTSNSGIGNAYVGMAFRAPNTPLNYVGAITVSAPTGSTNNGLSSGRAGVDFSNHISHSFNRFTPFVDAGVSNTVPDSQFSTRPFTSLGLITHWEEGADFEVVKHTYVGASGYQILPFGNQKVFSKLVDKGQGGGGTGSGNSFDNNAVSSGNDLTRENGFNAWVGFEPTPLWRAEVGFTRSMTFDLNSIAFNLRFNVGRMLRSRKIS